MPAEPRAPSSPIKRPLSSLFQNLSARNIVTGCPTTPTEERKAKWESMFEGKVSATASLFENQENQTPGRTAKAAAFQKARQEAPLPRLPPAPLADSPGHVKRQTWGPKSCDDAAAIARQFVHSRPASPVEVRSDRFAPRPVQVDLSRSVGSTMSPMDKINNQFEELLVRSSLAKIQD
jgi:hypothetical protein